MKSVTKVGLFLLLALPLLTHAEPIHDAVRNGNVQQVKLLLATDATETSVADAQDFNALAIALTMNNADICKVLLDSGANPNQRLLPTGPSCLETRESILPLSN